MCVCGGGGGGGGGAGACACDDVCVRVMMCVHGCLIWCLYACLPYVFMCDVYDILMMPLNMIMHHGAVTRILLCLPRY